MFFDEALAFLLFGRNFVGCSEGDAVILSAAVC